MNDRANILIVDDTPANLELLINLLESEGYYVRPAINGTLALNAVRSQPPDIILLDIMMPDIDGFQVREKLKADETTSAIPVIFISALDDTDNLVKGFRLGGADYITKPFKKDEVLARVENQLTIVRQREQLKQYYETLSVMKDQFVNSATHDLKNPLGIIVGYTELIEDDDQLAGRDDIAKYLTGIKRGAEKMQHLITDMLEFAQLGTGISLIIEDIILQKFLVSTVQNFEHMATAHHIALQLELPDNIIRLQLDEPHMERVIDNLVSNAIKYSPDGGTVTVSATTTDDAVLIQIKDEGLGIPEEALSQLFDPFYRVRKKTHQSIEGTGLGLSVVKTIVEQHGGNISVESQLGEGSTFTIKLPLI